MLRQPMFRVVLRGSLVLAATAALAACGFHLRPSAQLPAGMQRVHLQVSGGGDLPRELARAMEVSGTVVEDHSGAGIAELQVPVAGFRTDSLTMTGTARVGEYSVRYHVEFAASDAAGKVLVPRQSIDMSRDFTYDARESIGNETQVEEIEKSLVRDMVQAMLFRLQAVAEHPGAAQAAQEKAAADNPPAAAASSDGDSY
ncbi:MAG TPA: LPS assembly lipoprotein LptE [Rhodanobacteraceae bacterium]|jgi:LPS-assembly lipoprotein|nr:LPS assembly lipoprotein LptE [Rhodanobacteraceae bacterium]